MKRFIFMFVLFGSILASLSAQATITKFAVLDMNRVVASYTERLPEGKSYAEKRDRVQAEIEKQSKELQELNAKLAEAKENGSNNQIKNLENQIKTKTQALQTYIKNNMAELEKERDQLLKNDAIMAQITSIVRAVAESEGCSIVLSLSEPGVVWYSRSVDITGKVLERMRARR